MFHSVVLRCNYMLQLGRPRDLHAWCAGSRWELLQFDALIQERLSVPPLQDIDEEDDDSDLSDDDAAELDGDDAGGATLPLFSNPHHLPNP